VDLAGIEGGVFPGGIELRRNAGLRSLVGLEGVPLSGGLRLYENPELASLVALSSHTFLGGLSIVGNQKLAGVDGLENVGEAAGEVIIGSDVIPCNTECPLNEALTSLRGLSGLSYIDGNLRIGQNPSLPACEAEWLRDSIGVENIAGGVQLFENAGAGTCN
jgi:hypothetical protein